MIDLKTKLSAFWSLNGTRNDSQTTLHLSQVGSVPYAGGHVYPQAASFTGVAGNYLTITSSPTLSMGDTDYTISAWVYLTDKSTGRPIIAKYAGGGGNQDYLLDWQPSTQFRFVTFNQAGAGFTAADGGLSPSLNTWYHVCAWYDATARTVNLQVNDRTPVSVVFSGTKVTNTFNTHIGYQQLNNQYMHGRIGPVSVWEERILTVDERAYLYNDGAGRQYGEFVDPQGLVIPYPDVSGAMPQLALCDLIATALDGQEFGGFVVNAKSDNLLPRYELSDLSDTVLTVDVVPAVDPVELTQQTHGSAVEECPIVLSIEAKCDTSVDDTSYRAMLNAMRQISIYLQTVDLSSAGFHGPFSNSWEDQPAAVDVSGRMEGYISVNYQTITNT